MKKNGFTILEILIVVTIIAAASGFGLLYYQTTHLRADLNGQSEILVSYLRLAQSNTNSGKDSFNAIHFQQNSYIIFSGAVYDPLDPQNHEIAVPPLIIMRNFSFNGGGTDVIFDPPDGTTDNYGTLDLFSEQLNKNITLNITQIGSINY